MLLVQAVAMIKQATCQLETILNRWSVTLEHLIRDHLHAAFKVHVLLLELLLTRMNACNIVKANR